MKKIISGLGVLALMALSSVSNAQTITNGGFEDGLPGVVVNTYGEVYKATGWNAGCSQHWTGNLGYYQGTPDLYACNSTGAGMDLPAGNRLNPWSGGGCRFVGMLGPHSDLQRQESIIQNTGLFTDLYEYTISMKVARTNYPNQPTNIQMEIVLRKSGDCTAELVLPIWDYITVDNNANGTDPANATNNWTSISRTFYLTPQEAAQQYDNVEIRPRYTGVQIAEKVYVDDIALDKVVKSVANIEPVNNIGVEQVPSIWGPQTSYTFCQGEVNLDGSGSSNETKYRYKLSAFNLLAGTETIIYDNSTWTNGSVPSSIDPSFNGAYQLVPGVTYSFTVFVGPEWHYDQMFFTVENCCPEDLELNVNCEEGYIQILNLPSWATEGGIKWYKESKFGSTNITDGSSWVTSVPLDGTGMYTAVITITFPNGETCEITLTYQFDEDDCCTEEVLVAEWDDSYWINNGVTEYVTTVYGWGSTVPVVCVNSHQFGVDITGTACVDVYAYYASNFDPYNWADVGPQFNLNLITVNGPITTQIPFSYGAIVSDPSFTGYVHFSIWTNGGSLIDLVVKFDCEAEPKVRARMIAEAIEAQALNADNIQLYPNPTKDNVKVNLGEVQSGSVTILSTEGKEVNSSEFTNQDVLDLNTSDLPSGLYWINITIGNSTVTKKLIKE